MKLKSFHPAAGAMLTTFYIFNAKHQINVSFGRKYHAVTNAILKILSPGGLIYGFIYNLIYNLSAGLPTEWFNIWFYIQFDI